MRYKTSHSIFGSLPERAFRKKLGSNAPMTLEGPGCSGGGCFFCCVGSTVGCLVCCVGSTVGCLVCQAGQAIGCVGCFVCQNVLQPIECYACHKVQQFICCPGSGIARIGASYLTDGASCALCAAYCIACEAYCLACSASCMSCIGCQYCNPLCGCYGCGPCGPCCSSCCGPCCSCCSCCSSCGSNPKMPKTGGGKKGTGGKKTKNPFGSLPGSGGTGGGSGGTGGKGSNPLCSTGTKSPSLCLTGGTVHGQQVQLVCSPTFSEAPTPLAMSPMGGVQQCTMGMKKGGNVSLVCEPTFNTTNIPLPTNPYQQQSPVSCGLPGYEDGGMVEHQAQMVEGNPQRLAAYGAQIAHPQLAHTGPNPFLQTHKYAEGGDVHQPEFYSEGGLHNTYVNGKGDGTSDSIPAMLANGEFVIPADVVSSLGNGSNDSGAKVLDEFLKTIRHHKRDANPNKLPPDSKGPLGYLLEAKKKVK